MATFGSIPSRVFAVLAVAMAMEASSSGLGLMFMAQSPNSIRPLSPYSLLGISIMKQLEMVLMPLAIFIIWRPGLSVLPVVFIAPETMPSALPSFIIMQA